MKALTVRQPFAEMIASGEKIIEVRSWRTHYRGPLAIHASAKPDPGTEEFCREQGLDFGAVIGVVTLADCRPLTGPDREAALIDDSCPIGGLWAWVLTQAQPIEPMPAKGRLRLWEWPPGDQGFAN